MTRSRLALGLLFSLLVTSFAQAQARDTVAKTYFEFQVEKPVRHAPGSAAPRYPPALKAAGVEGEVLVQFVVDTLGAADLRSFKVLKASHGDFTESVKAALPDMKFVPAELRGRKVRQLVQQPFVFAIQKKDSTSAVVSVPPSRAQRPLLPPAAVTPAPRAGTVRGWTIARRISADSGDGSAGFSTVQRQFGTAGRLRFEIEAPTRFPLVSIVSLFDVATGRRTMLQESTKTATVTTSPRPSAMGFNSVFRPSANGITDLGAGDAIAGLPTRHYRVTGTTTTRYDLGDRVCTVSQEAVTEYWTTRDSAFTAIQRHLRELGPAAATGASVPVVDSSGLASLGPVLKFISDYAMPGSRGARSVKSTIEVVSFSEGDLEASLFEPPEGYQLRDLSSILPTARSEELRFVSAKRMFEQMVDTTRVVPGVTTTCTASKAP